MVLGFLRRFLLHHHHRLPDQPIEILDDSEREEDQAKQPVVNGDIVEIDSNLRPDQKESIRKQEWSLYRVLTDGQMLTDNEIFASLQLLQSQFKHKKNLKGFFDPQSLNSKLIGRASSSRTSQDLFYISFESRHRFIQILHDGARHWFVITNLKSKNKYQIQAYDSFYQDKTYLNNNVLKKSLRRLLVSSDSSKQNTEEGGNSVLIECSIEPVQKQNDLVMCGLFSIAFAYDLCRSVDPAHRHYNVGQMRSHLAKCLQQSFFEEFPSVKLEDEINVNYKNRVASQIVFIEI